MADAVQVQRRRGTQAQCDSATPVEGEIWVDTTYDTLRVGDGSKQGGYIMPNAYQLQHNQFNYAAAGGAANALTVTLYPAPNTASSGFSFKLRASANNTDAATISVNGASAVEIRKMQGSSIVPLEANDIINTGVYELNYNGTYYLLSNPIPVVTNDYQFVGRFTPSGSSGTWDILNIFEVGYDYEIQYVGLGTSQNNVEPRITFSGNGGGSWYLNYSSVVSGSLLSIPVARTSNSASGRSFTKLLLNDPASTSAVRVHSMEYSSSSSGNVDRTLFRFGGASSIDGANSIRISLLAGNGNITNGYANIWRKRAV